MSLLSLLALSLAPLTAKLRDSDDVALTRATAKIAELEQALADLQVRTEALERSIDRIRAPQQMTQQEFMQARQDQMMQQIYPQVGFDDERLLTEYIRNCTPGRAEVLRRSP